MELKNLRNQNLIPIACIKNLLIITLLKSKKMSKNLFNTIKLKKPNRNHFDLTHDVKMTANMGDLVPCMIMECVPGDKVKIQAQSLIRFAPLISPVMHRFDAYIHYFFVPNRLLWSGWEDFITGDASRVPPTVKVIGDKFKAGSLANYLGMPSGDGMHSKEYDINALPFLAYAKIYNDYYRDQNLISEINLDVSDGNNGYRNDLYEVRKRAWEHDYFTSALPFAQKGAAVDIPIGSVELPFQQVYRDVNPSSHGAASTIETVDTLGTDLSYVQNKAHGSGIGELYTDGGELDVNPTTINDLRRAFRLQEWLEKNARAGTRYVESILAHFGVKSSDARLQRSEYITGNKTPVVISEVLNTTGEDGGLPQGNMAGHGVSVGVGQGGSYFCEEHGFIIGIMSVMPKTAYQQGIPKHFGQRSDKFDYFWPEFANIGEQEIKNKELYVSEATTSTQDEATFGYIPRYAEYKFINNRVCGDFATSLKYWHNGRIFANSPNLNKTFIECVPRNDMFAVVDENVDKLYINVLNKVSAIRPLPKYGTPTF